MRAMDEQNVTQSFLAEKLGCSQQYISALLKGNSNITLETIAKVEDALDIDILRSIVCIENYSATPAYKRSCFLSESPEPHYGEK